MKNWNYFTNKPWVQLLAFRKRWKHESVAFLCTPSFKPFDSQVMNWIFLFLLLFWLCVVSEEEKPNDRVSTKQQNQTIAVFLLAVLQQNCDYKYTLLGIGTRYWSSIFNYCHINSGHISQNIIMFATHRHV